MSSKSCIPCNEVVALNESEVQLEYSKLKPNFWELVNIDGVLKLRRAFQCKNWRSAVEYINLVSDVAESEMHHPDLFLTSYKSLEIIIYTHFCNGLSIKDFELARLIANIPVSYSKVWAEQNPEKI